MSTTERFYHVYVRKDTPDAFNRDFVTNAIRSAIIRSYPEPFRSNSLFFRTMFLQRQVEGGGPGRYIFTVPLRLNVGPNPAPAANPNVPESVYTGGYSMLFENTDDPFAGGPAIGPLPFVEPPDAPEDNPQNVTGSSTSGVSSSDPSGQPEPPSPDPTSGGRRRRRHGTRRQKKRRGHPTRRRKVRPTRK